MSYQYYNLGCIKRKFPKEVEPNLRRILGPIFQEILNNLKAYTGKNNATTVYNLMESKMRNDLHKLWKLFQPIIPISYFGTQKNAIIFMRLCKKIFTRSAYECTYLNSLGSRFECNDMQWLNGFETTKKKEVLIKANKWLLDNVVKLFMMQYYQAIHIGKKQEVKFVKRSAWHSFRARVLNKLVAENVIAEVEKDNAAELPIKGTLIVLPKSHELTDLKYRTRLICHKGTKSIDYKSVNKRLLIYASSIAVHKTDDVFKTWINFREKVGNKEIYGATVDLENAFGNVDRDKIIMHLEQCQDSLLSDYVKTELKHVLNTQYVYMFNAPRKDKKEKIYKLNSGILQGHPLSASICELYQVLCDNEDFGSIDGTSCFFHRTVDDYLFCSTDKQQVISFTSSFKTRKINVAKTKTNIDSETFELPYCGRLFDLKNKEIKTLFTLSMYEMRYNFRFWSRTPHAPAILLERQMEFAYNNFHFNSTVLNLAYNRINTFLENYYQGMTYLALKFCECFVSLDVTTVPVKKLKLIVKNVINRYSRIVYRLARKFTTRTDLKSKLPFRKIVAVASQAFYNVLKTRSGKIFKEIMNHLTLDTKTLPHRFTKIPLQFRSIKVKRTLQTCVF